MDPDLDAQDPRPPSGKAIRKLAAHGQALVVKIPLEDCEATMRLQVNEDADEYLRERGTVLVRGAQVHVPSGEIKADGVEFIVRPGEVRTHSEAESCRVPAGDYDVEVLELINWKIKNVAAEVQRRTTPLERAVDRLLQAYTWCGILLIWGNILIAPAAVVIGWTTGGWKTALVVAAIVLVVDLVVLGGF